MSIRSGDRQNSSASSSSSRSGNKGQNGLSSNTPLSLSQMVIQSHDSLRGYETDVTIPVTWNDRPPLLTGPRQKAEDETLLKAVRILLTPIVKVDAALTLANSQMIRRGIPPALRCAVWLSNVIQAVHPHQSPEC
jgi:hypothetical protein